MIHLNLDDSLAAQSGIWYKTDRILVHMVELQCSRRQGFGGYVLLLWKSQG